MSTPEPITLTAPDGTRFRDLDHDQRMAPFEDPRLSSDDRTEDLLGRLSLAEKVGLCFHDIAVVGPEGDLDGAWGDGGQTTRTLLTERLINHVNVHALPSAREAARWANAVQAAAATTPHSIPVTLSTDPRHSVTQTQGAAVAAGAMSVWPEPLGLAALRSVERIREFADIARQEYLAVGIRSSLHPQLDLATEPRWGRQLHTFGSDPVFVSEVAAAYIDGFQLDRDLGPASVATMVKHFPGGGPQRDGEDPHFPYGREQDYPGGWFEQHLAPFRQAIASGTAAIMPSYGIPIGLELDGERLEPVAFGFSRQILTGLLRERLGYAGVICTDWGLITDAVVLGKPLPARAWGVEHLSPLERLERIIDAGADQLGGESRTDLLLQAVTEGRVSEQRLDESVRRLLRVKFQLGLFDQPFVDEDLAEDVVGREDFLAAGRRAQSESVVLLHNGTISGRPALPLGTPATTPETAPDATDATRAVYVEGLPPDEAARLGRVVADPTDADVAVVRLAPPFDPRDDLFLEAGFHQGSLAYRPGLVARLAGIARTTPLILDATLDRPALLAPLAAVATAIVAEVGASSGAVVDVLVGAVAPRGRLPFEVPRSAEAVRLSRTDVADDTADPLYRRGHGLRYGERLEDREQT